MLGFSKALNVIQRSAMAGDHGGGEEEWKQEESELKAAGAVLLPDGHFGIRLKGWHIESSKRAILSSSAVHQYAPQILSDFFVSDFFYSVSSIHIMAKFSGNCGKLCSIWFRNFEFRASEAVSVCLDVINP